MNYAPIIVFLYNRPDKAEKTLNALKNNTLATESDIHIFIDGAKNDLAKSKVKETKKVAYSVIGFKNIKIYESKKNKGLADSIISGVTEIINKYGTAIVIEDDIVTGKYFLEYMNAALEKYKDEKKVWHITGWHNPTKKKNSTDCFFYPLMDCWSWATWKDRWQYFEKNPKKIVNSFNAEQIKAFNVDGLVPNKWNQVLGNLNGRNNTWAIFWYATILKNHGLCLAPSNSIAKNIGCDNTGVHSKKSENYTITTSINNKITNFPNVFSVNEFEYNLLKNDYKKRFRFERIKQFIKKMFFNNKNPFYRSK